MNDAARITVSVNVPPERAFEVFTQEVDLWWRRGGQYRHFGGERALIAIEPREGGRVFESLGEGGPVHELGRVLAWQPPARLVFEWRLANFAPDERTEVEVSFEALGAGTKVTVVHRGWAAIRGDHPARHGEAPPVFIGTLGRWWAEQLRIYRMRAAAPTA